MQKLVTSLRKTKDRLFEPLRAVFSRDTIDARALEEIEELLLAADLGFEATERIIERLREKPDGVRAGDFLHEVGEEILSIIAEVPANERPTGKPYVLVIVGVNGVGKTSTIGKLAHRFRREGKTVLLAACDTFRPAAIEQLTLWADRAGVPVVKQEMGSDPAAIVYDAVQSAVARSIDIVIADTAGRLHNKAHLMEELGKIFRVLGNRGIEAEGYLVLDANTGQNSIQQAEAFVGALPVTGLILTKLDSTAKGGAVVPIQSRLRIPLLYVGVGEGLEDLEPFDSRLFVSALIGDRGHNIA